MLTGYRACGACENDSSSSVHLIIRSTVKSIAILVGETTTSLFSLYKQKLTFPVNIPVSSVSSRYSTVTVMSLCLRIENGRKTCLSGFSRCRACRRHVSRWWRCRKNLIVACSSVRRVRPASVPSAGNSTPSASVSLLRGIFLSIIISNINITIH